MDLGIKGKRALVCAASKGLGRGCAEALAEAGVNLVINARTEAEITRTAREIAERHGVEVTPVAADITTEEGRARVLAAVGHADILVVAPYNVQVNALAEALPGVRVGTVDKFQGQEADVVVYSMVSSSGDEIPRGLEFLLSRNRLNVAISRARSLSPGDSSPSMTSSRR